MKKRRIYLCIQGACGNQFFQYAFARQIQEKTQAELIINYRRVKNDPEVWQGSDNLLKDFNTIEYTYKNSIGPETAIFKLIDIIKRRLGFRDFCPETYHFIQRWAKRLQKIGIIYYDAAFFEFEVPKTKNIYINGYFESSRYFEKIDKLILNELRPIHGLLEKNYKLDEAIRARNSVCITIKRQDIDNPNISDIYSYDISYFYAGIKYIQKKVENPLFVIFSDDIEWCKHNIEISGDVLFETAGNPIWEKIRLMSECKHFIIHNSTFSWWAQHLSQNRDKIVLAPNLWMHRTDQPIDIYEQNWLYITPQGEIVKEHEENMK